MFNTVLHCTFVHPQADTANEEEDITKNASVVDDKDISELPVADTHDDLSSRSNDHNGETENINTTQQLKECDLHIGDTQ